MGLELNSVVTSKPILTLKQCQPRKKNPNQKKCFQTVYDRANIVLKYYTLVKLISHRGMRWQL